MTRKKPIVKPNPSPDTGLKLNDTFEFKRKSYKILHLSEIGVRAKEIVQKARRREPRTLYWFGVEQFESETGLKINTEGGFPVPIEPCRYVASPEGLGEIVEVDNERVKVCLFNSEGHRGRRKTATFTRDQLRSLSQYHPQLSNAGAYIKGMERIAIPYSREIETQAIIEAVQDIQDEKWRHGIEFKLPTTRGGIYGPSKFDSEIFDNRLKAIKAAIRDLKAVMSEELQRAHPTPDQRQKIEKAIEETVEWARQQNDQIKHIRLV